VFDARVYVWKISFDAGGGNQECVSYNISSAGGRRSAGVSLKVAPSSAGSALSLALDVPHEKFMCSVAGVCSRRPNPSKPQ
jgi:hypothetical protein